MKWWFCKFILICYKIVLSHLIMCSVPEMPRVDESPLWTWIAGYISMKQIISLKCVRTCSSASLPLTHVSKRVDGVSTWEGKWVRSFKGARVLCRILQKTQPHSRPGTLNATNHNSCDCKLRRRRERGGGTARCTGTLLVRSSVVWSDKRAICARLLSSKLLTW